MPIKTDGHSQSTPRTSSARVDAVASSRGFATKAIRTGQDPCPATGSTIVPVYQTATFTQAAVGQTKGFDYSRSGNPTRLALERQLADLEGARFAAAFGSGMAAIAGACALLRNGDHVVATRDIYGGTHRFFATVLERYGVAVTFVDMTDLEATRTAIRPETKMFWLETPTNPTLRLIDIAAVCRLRRLGHVVVVDNTFASPYFQRPLALGADVVVHSTTKYLGGHSDVVGGAVVIKDSAHAEALAFNQNATGAIAGPFDAWLTLRGIRTLAVRMDRHCANAARIAHALAEHPAVASVLYPGLPSHPGHELAKAQMRDFGGMVSFRLAAGEDVAVELCAKTRVFTLGESLGGVESLIEHPARMTHASTAGSPLEVPADLVRLSVGIEDPDDLLADLWHAIA
jgi:cystathionine gamma-synthase